MTYQCENETIERLHIVNQGFIWFFEVKDNPDIPEDGCIITEVCDKVKKEFFVPKECLSNFIRMLEKYGEANKIEV